MNRGVIDVRKLAALDLVFHGPRFVLIEFGAAVVLAGGLGVLSLRAGLSGPDRPVAWEIALGVVLVSIATNYLPLLIHTLALIRAGTARQEVATELEQVDRSQRRYVVQQFLLVVPLAVLLLAALQALRRSTESR